MAEMMLEVKNLHYHYGAIHALHGISLHVEKGEIVCLIGANGAGKSTTLGAISGLNTGITDGDIYYMGSKITRMSPHRVTALGIGQTLEGRHIFSQLTVHENLKMGAFLCKDKVQVNRNLDYVYNLFPRLKERRTQMGGTLSGGEQQMLAVGRALMQSPKLLMMDEPSLGLAPLIIEDIFRTIRQINSDGVTILLVEQNSNAALHVANRGYVLETGNIVLEDTAENLLNNEDVKKSYLGGGGKM